MSHRANCFFYIDSDGQRQDLLLHEAMLLELEERWSGSARQAAAIKNAVERLGLSVKDAEQVYS